MHRQYIITIVILIVSLSTVHANSVCYRTGDCTNDDTRQIDTQDTVTKTIDFTEPDVAALTPNTNLMYDRWYHRVNARTEVYDAPNGNVVRVIEEGFNFVTVLSNENGWTRINGDEWVRSEGLTDTSWVVSRFTGVELPAEGFEQTMTWALVNMYPSPEPGADPSENLDLIPRYTRLYIHDTVVVDGYNWYLVNDGEWVHQFRVALSEPLDAVPESVDTELWVGIDLYEQVLTVYRDDTPLFTTLVATGLPRWPTYEGTFHIYFRNPREYMSWGTVGDDFYSLEEVPWTMFFDEGRALHGAYWHDGFGYRRSHGCVNMSITDAYWLYQLVADEMGSFRSADYETGPAVYVYSTGEYD